MNRETLQAYIQETYHVAGDRPWARFPSNMVFRHGANRKWFALLFDAPKAKLGIEGEGTVPVVNVKCDPLQLGSFRKAPGVYPAYHMNKANWLTVALDGSAADDTAKLLVDISFALTAEKRPAKRRSRQ